VCRTVFLKISLTFCLAAQAAGLNVLASERTVLLFLGRMFRTLLCSACRGDDGQLSGASDDKGRSFQSTRESKRRHHRLTRTYGHANSWLVMADTLIGEMNYFHNHRWRKLVRETCDLRETTCGYSWHACFADLLCPSLRSGLCLRTSRNIL
jgi:hypothetical protein